ncbi:MAG: hypothetical protein ACYCZ6_11680 [Polaromonas sp.]
MKMEFDPRVGTPCSAVDVDIKNQCLRILRCTARAWADSHGGLRFKVGPRPWLDGLSVAWPGGATAASRRNPAVLQVLGD